MLLSHEKICGSKRTLAERSETDGESEGSAEEDGKKDEAVDEAAEEVAAEGADDEGNWGGTMEMVLARNEDEQATRGLQRDEGTSTRSRH